MDTFKSIDIDPRFIDGTKKYIKNHDTNNDGLDLEELKKAVLPGEDKFSYKEPNYYP